MNFANIKYSVTIISLIHWLIIIDLLFFPPIIFGLNISMFIIPFWFLVNIKKIFYDKYSNGFIILIFFSVISTLLSFIRLPEFISNNITVLFLIFLLIILYFVVGNMKVKLHLDKISLTKILITYVLFIFILSSIFLINPQTYFDIRTIWSSSNQRIEVTSLLVNRFTGIASDPNNMATIINAVSLFLIYNLNYKGIKSFVLILITGFITVSTLSSTGIIIYVITVLIYFINSSIGLIQKNNNIKVNIYLLFIGFISLPLVIYLMNYFFTSDIFQTFLYRLEINSADSRFIRWESLLENKNIFLNLFLGDGGTIIVNNSVFKPHNGHFHLIYNYGFLAYFSFMWIYFWPNLKVGLNKSLFLIPFFIGFTVNVGLIDPTFVVMLGLLVGYYKGGNKDING